VNKIVVDFLTKEPVPTVAPIRRAPQARGQSRLTSQRVVSAGAEVQVHPAALPLDLVDLAFAVVLAAGLECEQLCIPRERLECRQHVPYCHAPSVAASPHTVSSGPPACLAIQFSVGCALIIQTILLFRSGAVWTDELSNVSRLAPSGADQVDAEHPSRNRKVVGSNPTSGSKIAGQNAYKTLRTLPSVVP
jgi:hypothetical protein